MATQTITVRLTDIDQVQAVISAACAVLNEASEQQTITRQSKHMVDLYCALDALQKHIHSAPVDSPRTPVLQ